MPFRIYTTAQFQVMIAPWGTGALTTRCFARAAAGGCRGAGDLNAVGWLALITHGSVVSIAAAIAFPLVYAAALGAAAALFAYGVDNYFTVREIRRGAGGRPGGPPDGDASGDRKPRRPQSPSPTLSASRAVDERRSCDRAQAMLFAHGTREG
jgi:hypothetical protein